MSPRSAEGWPLLPIFFHCLFGGFVCNFVMGKVAVKGLFPGWNRQLFVHIRTVCMCVCVCLFVCVCVCVCVCVWKKK